MPAPAAPTGFDLTQAGGGFARAVATWDHDGIDLHRFELVSKASSDSAWAVVRREILAPASQFGAGPYSSDVALAPSRDYAVRALAADGSVSPISNVEPFSGAIAGKWLLPYRNGHVVSTAEVWMGSGTDPLVYEHSRVQAYALGREEAVETDDVLHLAEGVISGDVWDYNGQTKHEWANRLRDLVRRRKSYDKILYVTREETIKVTVFGPVGKVPKDQSGQKLVVSCGFREIA